jgi:putative phosphoribosyl transferase
VALINKPTKKIVERNVSVVASKVLLSGDLVIPDAASGIVLFAHGSGSSRHSPRNRFVARELQNQGLATLLFDLLTPAEESVDQFTGEIRFDIERLTQRLVGATDWIVQNPDTETLRIGYFGASTGAAAALVAATRRRELVSAVVSRGGRPDLAGAALAEVQAPTLLMVGGHDESVIELNRQALAQLRIAEKELMIVPGATHLFEEPGALEQVAKAAGKWFSRFLTLPRLQETHSLVI